MNCPKQFHEKHVAKTVKEEKTTEMIWGERVHASFETFVANGEVLPPELETHEPFLLKLIELPGEKFTERRIALNNRAQPCEFFDPDVWYRGIIDFGCVRDDEALIIDYKTGKQKNDFTQLTEFALWTFYEYPDVNVVRAEYYWTQLKSTNGQTFTRSMIPLMWSKLVPDLKQYAEAFQTDVWQPRPSGLCHGWCPVTDCEHWKPKRKR